MTYIYINLIIIINPSILFLTVLNLLNYLNLRSIFLHKRIIINASLCFCIASV